MRSIINILFTIFCYCWFVCFVYSIYNLNIVGYYVHFHALKCNILLDSDCMVCVHVFRNCKLKFNFRFYCQNFNSFTVWIAHGRKSPIRFWWWCVYMFFYVLNLLYMYVLYLSTLPISQSSLISTYVQGSSKSSCKKARERYSRATRKKKKKRMKMPRKLNKI